MIGLLWLGRRFLNFNNRFLAYANEAVLPFYILHQTVIFIVGFFVIQWSSGIATKYLMITIVSFAVIMAIYEILIKRVSIVRSLFGMKVKNESRNRQTALSVVAGLCFVLVMALVVVSLNTVNMSPPPAEPGLYVNDDFGFQLTYPTSMSQQGELTTYVLFHIQHPEKAQYLKIRKNAIAANQPLDPQAGNKWIRRIMRNLGIKNPEVLSTELLVTPDGTEALHAAVKFQTDTVPLVGTYVFFDKNGKRFFVAGYNDDGFEPLEQIVKSLTFK